VRQQEGGVKMKVRRKKPVGWERVMSDYNKLKKIARICFRFGFYSWAMDVIHNAVVLMYNFNIIYHDEECELLLEKISKKIFPDLKTSNYSQYDRRVVFYDYFSWDNRGLTEQYLRGLIDNEYEILYISLEKDQKKCKNILELLNGYEKSRIYFIKNQSNRNKCKEILDKITRFKPSKLLYHSAPWDTVGFAVLSCLEAYNVKRFLINLTDHTFWLGRNCCDYFLEFRNYGANISIDHRNIDTKKLLLIPYYPICEQKAEFQGFPFEEKGKKVIVSGGSLYKIYGSEIYFDIAKTILNLYPESVIFYLGNGDTKPLMDFIKKNQFENRFYYSKERRDINEIIKRCYFYLGTYPVAGGLMSQFAVANKKIPICFTEKKYLMNNIDELFINNSNHAFTFYDFASLYNEVHKLMTNNEYYQEKQKILINKLISRDEFAKLLKTILEDNTSYYKNEKYDIDVKAFSQIYFEQENNYLHKYENCFYTKRNILIFILFPHYAIRKIYRKFCLVQKQI
jgi:hypothetical protein